MKFFNQKKPSKMKHVFLTLSVAFAVLAVSAQGVKTENKTAHKAETKMVKTEAKVGEKAAKTEARTETKVAHSGARVEAKAVKMEARPVSKASEIKPVDKTAPKK
ncbi:MAG: hypothetical protein IPP77_05645 [Bacteroidetes bacterium]|nr:hypothetical protein [Bacteroidota bacterium]